MKMMLVLEPREKVRFINQLKKHVLPKLSKEANEGNVVEFSFDHRWEKNQPVFHTSIWFRNKDGAVLNSRNQALANARAEAIKQTLGELSFLTNISVQTNTTIIYNVSMEFLSDIPAVEEFLNKEKGE